MSEWEGKMDEGQQKKVCGRMGGGGGGGRRGEGGRGDIEVVGWKEIRMRICGKTGEDKGRRKKRRKRRKGKRRKRKKG